MTVTQLRRMIHTLTTAVGATALMTASISTSPGPAAQPHSSDALLTDAAITGPQAAATAGGPEPLFTEPRTAGTLPAGWAKYAIRRAVTMVSDKVIASGAIVNAEGHLLNLFPDVQILAMRNRVESRSSRDYSWLGNIVGDPYGSVVIAVVDGKLGAAVTHSSGQYVVLPGADGYHDVLQIDDNRVPQADDSSPPFDEPPVVTGRDRAPSERQRGSGAIDDGGHLRWFDSNVARMNGTVPGLMRPLDDPGPDNGTIIDVMVVYTSRAASEAGSDANLAVAIALAIDDMNLGFQNSQVDTQLKMQPFFPLRESTFVETGDLERDRTALKNMDSIQDLRDTFAADLVLFVTASEEIDGTEACGEGAPPFIVINWKAVPSICFHHEMGHGLGLVHDWYQSVNIDLAETIPNNWNTVSDGHGHTQIPAGPGGMRTIMAYRSWCDFLGISCSWKRRWSNPAVLENGHPFGIWDGQPFPTNEVAALNRRRTITANFKLSGCRATTSC